MFANVKFALFGKTNLLGVIFTLFLLRFVNNNLFLSMTDFWSFLNILNLKYFKDVNLILFFEG
jgi:hypothetical protein